MEKDLVMDLLDLLEKIATLEGKFTPRLRNVNPRWLIPFTPLFYEHLKSRKIGYLLSPVMSGSNRILKRIN